MAFHDILEPRGAGCAVGAKGGAVVVVSFDAVLALKVPGALGMSAYG